MRIRGKEMFLFDVARKLWEDVKSRAVHLSHMRERVGQCAARILRAAERACVSNFVKNRRDVTALILLSRHFFCSVTHF